MICPVCNQLSTFQYFFDEIYQHVAPVRILCGSAAVDYDKIKLNQTFTMEDDPEIVVCDRCDNSVDIQKIKVV